MPHTPGAFEREQFREREEELYGKYEYLTFLRTPYTEGGLPTDDPLAEYEEIPDYDSDGDAYYDDGLDDLFDADEIEASDRAAVDKAIYQTNIANQNVSGLMQQGFTYEEAKMRAGVDASELLTPYDGPPLSPLEVGALTRKYPGIESGIDLDDADSFFDLADPLVKDESERLDAIIDMVDLQEEDAGAAGTGMVERILGGIGNALGNAMSQWDEYFDYEFATTAEAAPVDTTTTPVPAPTITPTSTPTTTADVNTLLFGIITGSDSLGQKELDMFQEVVTEGASSWSEIQDWMNLSVWEARVRAEGGDPEEFRRKITDQFELPTGPSLTAEEKFIEGVTAAMTPGDLASAPAYWDQFSRIFNSLPGSQRPEAQSGKSAMFSDAEALFYLTADWSEHDWLWETPTPSLRLEETDRVEEEKVFAEWVENTYLKDPRDTRFGPAFYDKVRDLRRGMGEIKDMSMSEVYGLLREKEETKGYKEAQNKVINRFVFMEPGSSRRLAKLVGMYNIHPGADNWLKANMMGFYSGMMDDWLASGRTSYDFIETFVKDEPAMPGNELEWDEKVKEMRAGAEGGVSTDQMDAIA